LSDGSTHNIVTPAADIVPKVCHTVTCISSAINGGAMNGWDDLPQCRATMPDCLQQFQPDQIAIETWMADNGVLLDRFFTEENPSAGAHMFFITGEDKLGFTGDNPTLVPQNRTAGPGWGCNSNKKGPWVSPEGVQSQVFFCNPNAPELPYGGAEGPTPVKGVPDFFTSVLDPHRVTWKNYGGNPAWLLPPFQAEALHRDAANIVPSTRVLTDAGAGSLPNVSFVTPHYNEADSDTSQHNDASMAKGNIFIRKVIQAVINGPDAESSAVLLTWDDCGCFYDHVRPPRGLGPRTPLLIWSPWAKAGKVDHQVAQFGSILAFIEANFGLPSLTSLNPNAVDGVVANNLMRDFDFSQQVATTHARLNTGAVRLPPPDHIPPAEEKWLTAHVRGDSDDDT
jgi:phospholipase C